MCKYTFCKILWRSILQAHLELGILSSSDTIPDAQWIFNLLLSTGAVSGNIDRHTDRHIHTVLRRNNEKSLE